MHTMSPAHLYVLTGRCSTAHLAPKHQYGAVTHTGEYAFSWLRTQSATHTFLNNYACQLSGLPSVSHASCHAHTNPCLNSNAHVYVNAIRVFDINISQPRKHCIGRPYFAFTYHCPLSNSVTGFFGVWHFGIKKILGYIRFFFKANCPTARSLAAKNPRAVQVYASSYLRWCLLIV